MQEVKNIQAGQSHRLFKQLGCQNISFPKMKGKMREARWCPFWHEILADVVADSERAGESRKCGVIFEGNEEGSD